MRCSFPPGRPDAGEEALYEEAGWALCLPPGRVFTSTPATTPPRRNLHTDPAVQALSLKMACRSAVFSFVCWAIVIALRSSELFSGDGFLNLVEYPLTALVFAFLLSVAHADFTAKSVLHFFPCAES